MTSHPKNQLAAVRGKARVGILIEGLALLALSGAFYLVLSYTLDRSLRLEVGYRAGLLIGLAMALAWFAWRRLLRPLAFRLSDEELALAVERHDPESHESLISALHFERALASGVPRGSDSAELMRLVIEDVKTRAHRFAYGKALDGGRVARFLGVAACCAVFGLGWLVVDRPGLAIWAKRNLLLRDFDWPRWTLLEFTEANSELRVPEGDDLTLRVKASGVVPDQVFADCRFADGERSREPMTLTGEAEFTLNLQALLHDVRVRCRGGDGETKELSVKLVQRPRVQGLALRLAFPAYMKREAEVIADSDVDVRVPRGGKLEIAAKSTKPIKRAFVAWGSDQKQDLAVAADKLSLSGGFEPTETGLVTLDVLDEDTLGAARPPRFFVRIVEDMPPKLEFKPLAISAMITAQAIIPGDLKARDDYGLTVIEGSMRIVEPPPASLGNGSTSQPTASEASFERAQVLGLDGFRPPALDHAAKVAVDLLPLSPDPDVASPKNRLRPDMTVSLRFTAKDNFGPGDPHVGESETITFRVVTREKLLEDIQRRQEEQRKELIQIIQQEKNDLSELKLILSPTSEDPRARQAKLRLDSMARTERALGKRCLEIAKRYKGLLDEMSNNRLIEEAVILKNEAAIVQPLVEVSSGTTRSFPSAANDVEEFARGGHDDARDSAAASYESIIKELEKVLKSMFELESFSAVLRELREVITLTSEVRKDTLKQVDDVAGRALNPITNQASRPSSSASRK